MGAQRAYGRRLRRAGAWLGMLLAAATSAAAAAPEGVTPTVQEVVVTGSRLPKADLTADSPIVTVSQAQVQASGSLTLETLLNQLPQVVPSFSSAANNPSANGAAYVNLRGLGVSRNLVLLDGRRVVGANASNSVDLNTIPPGLIDRVEVITGGASAVYGADAVAGVVNVILKDHFDGLEAQGRSLVSQRGDGKEQEVSLSAGRRFERGSLMASLSWSERDEIGKGARPFSSQAPGPSSFLPSGGYFPGFNLPSQAAVNTVFGRYGVAPGAVSTRGGVGGYSFNGDGTLFATGQPSSPFDVQNFRGSHDDIAQALYPDVYAYNYQPFNKLILPLQRWSGALFADVQLTDRVSLFGRAMATRYSASTALAPTTAPSDANPLYPGAGIGAFTIPVTNPFIPADLAQLLASRRGDSPALAGSGPGEEFLYKFRAVQLGPRQSANRSDVGNLLGGAKIDFGHGWRGEVYASYGRYDRTETQGGLLAVRKFEQILDSPTGGTEFCSGGFNPFGGAMSASCRDFLKVSVQFKTRVEQTNAVASASGPLFHLPDGPVLAAVGAEYRGVSVRFATPPGIAPGDVAGFTSQSDLGGSIRFVDLFGEATAPLLADRPFAHALDLTVGYRRSTERTTGGVDSYKAELGWSPVPTFKIRAGFQRAVRAPDVFERYEPANSGTVDGHDPCSSDSPLRTAQVLALCRRQGAALGFAVDDVDSFLQDGTDVGVLNGGNPKVEPERATTFTLGAVWRPDSDNPWFRAPAATVDGYEIRIAGAIAYRDPQLLLNACYNIGGGNPNYDPNSAACRLVTRSTADFSLFNVDARESNQSTLEASGIDAALAFRTVLADILGQSWMGSLESRFTVSWLSHFWSQPSAAQTRIDYVGTIADSSVGYATLPRWKAQANFDWLSGPVSATLAGRYVDAMEPRGRRIGATQPNFGTGPATYWDLSGRWDVDRRVALQVGVLNLFDRGPEIYFPAVDASTEPSTFDVIGRRFWMGLTLRY